MPSLQNFIVHIKNVETNEHIIEPMIALEVCVDFHQDFTEVFSFEGNFRVPGIRTGNIEMSFTTNDAENFSALWDNDILKANIEICQEDGNFRQEYKNCALSSMQHTSNQIDGVVEFKWVFFETNTNTNSTRPRIIHRPELELKLDWRESGF